MSSIARSRVPKALCHTGCTDASAAREVTSSPRMHEGWDAAPFTYFYTEATDVFWHNMELFKGDGATPRAIIGKNPRHRNETLRVHNERIIKDWADYNEGRSGQPERLQMLQVCVHHWRLLGIPPISFHGHMHCRVASNRTCWTMHLWTAHRKCCLPCSGALTRPPPWRRSGCMPRRGLPPSYRCPPPFPSY
jgi:hypothetical protein